MPKVVHKTLSFPLAGVSRRSTYRKQERPYAAPWAMNVRGMGPLERRGRGGSRPGLSKVNDTAFGTTITAIAPVTSISSAEVRTCDLVVIVDGLLKYLRGSTITTVTTDLQDDNGVSIFTDDGDTILFGSTVSTVGPVGDGTFDIVERNGRLLIADTTLREYNPQTGALETVVATEGVIPTACPLVSLYRDRVFLSGVNHVWYASRQSDQTDWDFGADHGDSGRAVAGEVSQAGRIGDVITAMIPNGDSILTIATQNGIWVLRGDPSDGTLSQLSSEIGILAPGAWAMSPEGLIVFLSNDGVYVMSPGERPQRWSAERIPEELRNVSVSANTVSMAYDAHSKGFHLFVTPDNDDDDAAVSGTHWWLDVTNKAFWPVVVPAAMQPLTVTRLQGTSGLAEVALGCKDGYVRKFSYDATADDSTDIESHVLLGPFRLAADDMLDAALVEIHGIMADSGGTVTWHTVMADSAETAADNAVSCVNDDLSGSTSSLFSASGDWSEDRNKVARPRTRGAWCVVWLSSAAAWAYEAVAVRINQLGRIR